MYVGILFSGFLIALLEGYFPYLSINFESLFIPVHLLRSLIVTDFELEKNKLFLLNYSSLNSVFFSNSK